MSNRSVLRLLTLALLTTACASPALVVRGDLPPSPAGSQAMGSAPIGVMALADARAVERRTALGARLDRSGSETRRYGEDESIRLGWLLAAYLADAMGSAGHPAERPGDPSKAVTGPRLRGRVEQFWLSIEPDGLMMKRAQQHVRLALELVDSAGVVRWTGSVTGTAGQRALMLTAQGRSRVVGHAVDQALERAVVVFGSPEFESALEGMQSGGY